MSQELKDFKGEGIFCYVSKNQIALAYCKYIECFKNNNFEHTNGLTEQNITLANTVIGGMNDNALVVLWNTMHGFKHETFVKVDQCFIQKSVNIQRMCKIVSIDEIAGVALTEMNLHQIGQVQTSSYQMKVSAFSEMLPITEEQYLETLAEWQGDDSGKNHPEVEEGLIG